MKDEELNKPLTNRGFLLGCSLVAEAISSKAVDPKKWQDTLTALKIGFIKDLNK